MSQPEVLPSQRLPLLPSPSSSVFLFFYSSVFLLPLLLFFCLPVHLPFIFCRLRTNKSRLLTRKQFCQTQPRKCFVVHVRSLKDQLPKSYPSRACTRCRLLWTVQGSEWILLTWMLAVTSMPCKSSSITLVAKLSYSTFPQQNDIHPLNCFCHFFCTISFHRQNF